MVVRSPASLWRQELAGRIARSYATSPELEAALLIGSAARGWADAYSDVELAFFWRIEPSEEERRLCAERAGGTGWNPSPFDVQIQAWTEEYQAEGVKIDTGHWTVDAMEGILEGVVGQADSSLPKQTSASAVLHGVPLHGEALMSAWKARVSRYPPALAEATVREHLSFSPQWMRRMLAERNDFLLVRQNLCASARQLFLVLCGLNHKYYGGHKWVAEQVREFSIAPPDLEARLRRLLETPPLEAAEEMGRLIQETFDLVESCFPEVEVAKARKRLLEAPHLHPAPPSPATGSRNTMADLIP